MALNDARRSLGGRAVGRALTRRGLWGWVPRRAAPAPPGRPTLALSFDLDYQRDTDVLSGLVNLVGEVGADLRMTLFSIGRLIEQAPAPYREAVEAGHELANHTHTHPDNPVLNPDREFWHLSVEDMAQEIGRCQDAIQRHTGAASVGFRTPHFKDAPRMMRALRRFERITYLSTTLASRCPRPTPYFPTSRAGAGELMLHFPAQGEAGWPQLMIPLTPCPGLRWSPFCSYCSIRRPSDPKKGAGLHTLEQWERLWTVMLDRAKARRFASVYFDPMDVMRDQATRACFRRMLHRARETGWDVTSLAEVERRWRPVVEGRDNHG